MRPLSHHDRCPRPGTRSRLVRTLAAGVLLAGCGLPALAQSQTETTEDAAGASVEGVASYRERIALPPGAVFEAAIEDVSRADAPSTVIGTTVIDNPMPPIRFTISFDPAEIAPERSYAIRARILVDGQLRFTSDHVHRVLTRGAGRWVEIPLRAVGGSGPRPTDDGRRSETAPPKPMSAPEPAYIPAHGLRPPATFRGDLPCADCEAVRHHLDLWPDQVFHLRREWLGKEPIIGNTLRADIGRWRIDPGRRALVLHGGAEMPLQFQILGADRLRQLDLAGKPIESDLPSALNSDGTLDPTDVSLFMAGEMTDQADSPRFTECLTGRS
jgi:copper homeostasis protein (lipoprotein)